MALEELPEILCAGLHGLLLLIDFLEPLLGGLRDVFVFHKELEAADCEVVLFLYVVFVGSIEHLALGGRRLALLLVVIAKLLSGLKVSLVSHGGTLTRELDVLGILFQE